MPVPAFSVAIEQALAKLGVPAGEVQELNFDGKVKASSVEVSGGCRDRAINDRTCAPWLPR